MDAFSAEILFSAILWIPYSLLLLYLFYEHFTRSRNLQSTILLSLFLGSVFRAAWFWFYFSFVDYIYSEVVNRIAMLFQFSGLTVLMLMWGRAIAIARLTDTAYNETSRNLIAISKDTVAARDRKSRVQRYQEANQAVLSKVSGETLFKKIYIAAIVTNVAVWGFVLGSLANQSQLWYNINIIGISVVCLVLAVLTLLVGVRVSLALHVALSPVYLNNEGATGYNQEQKLKCVCMGRYGARCEYLLGCCGLCSLYAFIFNYNQSKDSSRQGLQMQREVLKVILSVSTITSFFFLLRSFVFLYRPVVKEYAGREEYSNEVDGSWAYPFFYYQIPELVPNLVIALGISPPNGVLRQFVMLCKYLYHVIVHSMYCDVGTVEYPQQSVFNADTSRTSMVGDAIAAASSRNSNALPTEATDGRASLSARPAVSTHVPAPTHTQAPVPVPTFTSTADAMERGNEVVSPVHARSSNIPIGSQSDRAGNMSAYQGQATYSGQGPPQAPLTAQNPSFGAKSTTNLFSLSNSAGPGRSTGTASLGGSVGGLSSGGSSPRKKRNVAVSLRRNAARGTWEAHVADPDAELGDDEEWVRERRDSAEMAEMLYRINSFSTMSEATPSEAYSTPSSLTNSDFASSVESNTILNSRRQNIGNVTGGNTSSKRMVSVDNGGKSSGGWGWFT